MRLAALCPDRTAASARPGFVRARAGAGARSRASSGRSRTASACSAAKPISSATSRPGATTACSAPSGGSPIESDGRGWARDTVERLCVDRAGRLMEFCERDGTREIYLSPGDHRIGVVLAAAPADAVNCVWTFEDGSSEPRQFAGSCDEEMRLRVVHGRPTTATRRHRAAGRHRPARRDRDPGARRADRRARRLDRRRRRQSRPPGAALRRRFLLPPLPRRRDQRVLPARTRRLQRQPLLRDRGIGPACRRLGAPERALAFAARAIARSTATRCAPRSGSRSRTRASPSPSFRSPAPARRSRPASSARSASPNARARAPTPPARRRRARRSPTLTEALATARKHRADRTPRPRAAHHRRQRHPVRRAGRRRHHRGAHRAAVVRPQRPHRLGRGFAEHPRPQPAAAISSSCARRSSRWSAAISRAWCSCPTGTRRWRRPAPPAPAAATASTCTRPSAPIRSGCGSVVEFVSNEFLPKIKRYRDVRRQALPRSARPSG